MTTNPPCPEAAAHSEALPLTRTDARHDVLGHAPADVAVNGDGGLLVHAGDKIAGMAADMRLRLEVESDRDIVHAVGIEDLDHAHVCAGAARWCRY